MDSEYFVSINNVSRELDIPAYTLRYWEKQFPTIVHPTTGAGGRRYYRAEMVARLRTIQDLLYNRGMTIAGVKKLIRSGDFFTECTEQSVPLRPTKTQKPKPTINMDEGGIEDIESVFRENIRMPISNSVDGAKLDVAIGLLGQAKDLLQ